MSNSAAVHAGKRILIPLFYDYYLFDYFRFLIPKLLDGGFRVTLYTFDRRVAERYAANHPEFRLAFGNPLLRALLNRAGKTPYRIGLWIAGWLWGLRLTHNYDFAVLPWDNKPLWYIASRCLPSLTALTVTTFVDTDGMLDHMAIPDRRRRSVAHRVLLVLDRVTRGHFVPKTKGRILNYRPIDRLLGHWAHGTVQGLSGISYFTVTGSRIGEIYESCGVGREGRLKQTRMSVVGSPAYEPVMGLPERFGEAERDRFAAGLGIDRCKRLFTFFLSPSSFSEGQIEEVATVAQLIRRRYPDATIALKFHPKTRAGESERFRARLNSVGDDLKTITEFGGDEFNARLILISDAIVQKQSTVGFIALLFRTPIVSYNLVATGYEDDMYRHLGGLPPRGVGIGTGGGLGCPRRPRRASRIEASPSAGERALLPRRAIAVPRDREDHSGAFPTAERRAHDARRDGMNYVFDLRDDSDCRARALAHLREAGFVVARGVIPEDVVEYVVDRIPQILNGPALGGSVGYYMKDCAKKMFDPFLLGGPTVQLAVNEWVLDLVEEYLDGDCILAEVFLKHDLGIRDVYFPVHADFCAGAKLPGVQDIRITSESMQSPLAVGAMLLLHDTIEGGIRYSVGSHKLCAPHGKDPANYPYHLWRRIASNMRRIDGRKGDLILFDDRGFHGPDQPVSASRTVIIFDYYKVAVFGRFVKSPAPVFVNDLTGLNTRQLEVLGWGAGVMIPYESHHMRTFRNNPYYRVVSRVFEAVFGLSRLRRKLRNRLKGHPESIPSPESATADRSGRKSTST